MTKLILLTAGGISAFLEPETSFLRRVCYRNIEVLRGVYAAVRDRNWCTIEPRIENLEIDQGQQRFCIRFNAVCKLREINFTWQGQIEGNEDGKLSYQFDGVAQSSFLRNRIGLCVLHAPQCAGLPCEIQHVNGDISQSQFPEAIAPHQPFLDIRGMRHTPSKDLSVHVQMEGDTFETEDQRNWTDASFKTYCTPLAEKFPIEVKAGTRIKQTVKLSIEPLDLDNAAVRTSHGTADEIPKIEWGESADRRSLPLIGLGCASSRQQLSERQMQLLRVVAPGHLRVDVKFDEEDALATLSRAAEEAQRLSTRLEVALFLTSDAENELHQVADLARREDLPIARWLVFDAQEQSTCENHIPLAHQILSDQEPQTPIFSGTNANFANLNHRRPPRDLLDGVCYSINPQVHAFDDASMMETPSTQAETVRSTRSFLPGVPIAVTPVTLRPRFNPVATSPERELKPGELPPQVDPRQRTCFAAAWTLASLKYLCESGVDSVTYYETVGWRGVMESESGSLLPDKFPSTPGDVFPLFHVLADLGEWRDAEIIPSHNSDPLVAVGLVLRQGKRQRVLVGNLSGQQTTLQIALRDGCYVVRQLDDSTRQAAATRPMEYRSTYHDRFEVQGGLRQLDLRPYAVLTIDQEPQS